MAASLVMVSACRRFFSRSQAKVGPKRCTAESYSADVEGIALGEKVDPEIDSNAARCSEIVRPFAIPGVMISRHLQDWLLGRRRRPKPLQRSVNLVTSVTGNHQKGVFGWLRPGEGFEIIMKIRQQPDIDHPCLAFR